MTVLIPDIKTLRPQFVKTKRYIHWQEFERLYLTREDGFKYEWHDGLIEKTPRSMNPNQFYIWVNLTDFLNNLSKKQGKDLGVFPMEADIFLQKILHKRPDIAHYTRPQVDMAADNEIFVPEFIAEIMSPSDNINRVNNKVHQYFQAGVKVLWHIFPETKQVHVYTNGGKNVLICKEEQDICSANEVIKDFNMTIAEVFKRNKKN